MSVAHLKCHGKLHCSRNWPSSKASACSSSVSYTISVQHFHHPQPWHNRSLSTSSYSSQVTHQPRPKLSTQCVASSNEQAPSPTVSSQESQPETLEDRIAALDLEVETTAGRVVIRSVADNDVMGACVVLTRAFAGTPEQISLDDAKKYVDNVLKTPGGGALFVARVFPNDTSLLPPNQDSRLIGTVALSLKEDTLQNIPTLPPPKNTAYLSNMAIDVKFRRLGVARALMRICDAAAQLAGLPEIYLHVRQGDEPAYKLYSSSGYQEIERDSFIGARLKNVRPRILMKKAV